MVTLAEENKVSPMMAQWHACKKQAPQALLFFRLGDFYEAFYEDASILSKELDLTLTKRQEIPMCGVPAVTIETYIDRLVVKGFHVAVAEQLEDPRQAKGIVKREIVRIVTPGSVINSSLLNDKSNNFFACIRQINTSFGLACVDLTTSDARACHYESLDLLKDELCCLKPAEILIQQKFAKDHASFIEDLKLRWPVCINIQQDNFFNDAQATQFLLSHFQVANLDRFPFANSPSSACAFGVLLLYLRNQLSLCVDHLKSVRTESTNQYLQIDNATQRHLELFESSATGSKKLSLLHLLDHTQTPMGGRLLRQWLSHPLQSIRAIKQRQSAITTFLENSSLSSHLGQLLGEVRDLERLIMRIETGYASPRDLFGLKLSLKQISPITLLLQAVDSPLLNEARTQLKDVSDVAKKIEQALVEDPPLRLSDGGIIRLGYHPEIDALRALQSGGAEWVQHYQQTLRDTTQIKTLKVGYTQAFGYFIEVSRGQSERVPQEFQRRQTLVNAERFITPELKEFEYRILHAEERLRALEQELFHALRREVGSHAQTVRSIAAAIAEIDCLNGLALVARRHRYVCPEIDESDDILIEKGRHPIVEMTVTAHSYIPNDVVLNPKQRLNLITGPNMAGKSTYIRQTALIVIMAHMGSFVPASKARIGLVDKVFSRIGASDDLTRGQSTFMVEMTETAHILKNATPKSLIVLDEIGRGTSTYDGISIAWAVAEYLLTHNPPLGKTLFATHYFELTELKDKIPLAVNYTVAVKETAEGIIFLHKIIPGIADKSYGVHVARLAGLPYAVIQKANQRLALLENNDNIPKKALRTAQFDLFAPAPSVEHPIMTELKKMDLDQLTPMNALQQIHNWQKDLNRT